MLQQIIKLIFQIYIKMFIKHLERPISFTVSNSTTPSAQSVPSIDNGAGENSTKVLALLPVLDVNTNSLVSGAITANVTATHPLKSTLSNGGSATTGNGFLIDNRTLASTNLAEEDFTMRHTEKHLDLTIHNLLSHLGPTSGTPEII